MITWSILQENITVLDMYAPNKRAPKYMMQKLVDKSTTLSVIDRSSNQKISKDIDDLNSIINRV